MTTNVIVIALVIFTVVITAMTLRVHWRMKQSVKATKADAQARTPQLSAYNIDDFPSDSIFIFDVKPQKELSAEFKALLDEWDEASKPELPFKL